LAEKAVAKHYSAARKSRLSLAWPKLQQKYLKKFSRPNNKKC
jgi:hypothetical protein